MIPRPLRPAIVWLALVLFLGTAAFGPQQTQNQVMPLLHTLVPWLSASALKGLHAAVRKLAHFVEYAILALLWRRAFRFRSRLDLRQASWAALAMCLACAIVDEVHQARVPGRHGTVEDVVLDTLGAAAALMIVRARRQAPDASQPSGSPTTRGPVRLDERA